MASQNSSHGSQSSGNLLQVLNTPVVAPVEPHCVCDMASVERFSWSENNPGRRFRNCMNSMFRQAARRCNFFMWVDPALTDDHYRNLLLKMKRHLDELIDNSYPGRLVQRINELENLLSAEMQKGEAYKEVAEGELAKAQGDLEKVVEELKVAKSKHRRTVVAMFVFFVGLFIAQQMTMAS